MSSCMSLRHATLRRTRAVRRKSVKLHAGMVYNAHQSGARNTVAQQTKARASALSQKKATKQRARHRQVPRKLNAQNNTPHAMDGARRRDSFDHAPQKITTRIKQRY